MPTTRRTRASGARPKSLAASGRSVLVLGLRRPELPAEDVLQGVHVRRLNEQRHQGAGLGTYLREYLSFLVRSGWAAVKLHRRRRFGLVQVHSLPDFLVFAALPLRLVGVPVLLDLHEAMPEFFVTRFPRSANPLSHRLLLLQERLSIAFATHVLTVNEAFGDRLWVSDSHATSCRSSSTARHSSGSTTPPTHAAPSARTARCG